MLLGVPLLLPHYNVIGQRRNGMRTHLITLIQIKSTFKKNMSINQIFRLQPMNYQPFS